MENENYKSTPRTDAAAYDSQPGNPMCPNGSFVVKADFARTLERETAQLAARIAELEKQNAAAFTESLLDAGRHNDDVAALREARARAESAESALRELEFMAAQLATAKQQLRKSERKEDELMDGLANATAKQLKAEADLATATSAVVDARARGKEDLRAFWREQSEWSQATFGTDAERGPIGALKHLAKEAVEAQACPQDLMEFVDCLFLTFDATRRAGFTFDELLEAAWLKLAINKARKWPKPGKSDEPVEHDRSGESAADRSAMATKKETSQR